MDLIHPMSNKIFTSNIKRLQFSENSFDCIVDTFGLQYVSHPQSVLRELERVCKKDGRIFLLEQGLPNTWFSQYTYRKI